MAGFGPGAIDRLRAMLPDDIATPPVGDRRAAGVLIPLFVEDDQLGVVLTLRTTHLRRHSGQVSFPGGGYEPKDASLRSTALRESYEEIGLHPSDVDMLGVLEDFATVGSDFVIRPYVGLIPHPYDFVLDAHEVDRIISPPLALFADPSARREELRERDGRAFTVYFFEFDEATVWGATARMLVSLVELLR